MFQNTDYQYYTLMGEGFNPFYSSQWNKELIQPPLVKEIQDEKSKECQGPSKNVGFGSRKM